MAVASSADMRSGGLIPVRPSIRLGSVVLEHAVLRALALKGMSFGESACHSVSPGVYSHAKAVQSRF
jgi:hypothetical protein